MKLKNRFWLIALAAVLGGALASLLLLAALHRLLNAPTVVAFDSGTQAWIHQATRPLLTSLALAFTWLGAIKIFAPAVGIVVTFLLVQRRRHSAVLLVLSITGAFLLNEALKLHFHRPRPAVPWSIGDEHTYSFPSGHSLFSVVLYGTLTYLATRSKSPTRSWPLAAALAFGIGLSRIYLGMHWPTDVLAGWLAGGIWLVTVILLDRFATDALTLRPD